MEQETKRRRPINETGAFMPREREIGGKLCVLMGIHPVNIDRMLETDGWEKVTYRQMGWHKSPTCPDGVADNDKGGGKWAKRRGLYVVCKPKSVALKERAERKAERKEMKDAIILGAAEKIRREARNALGRSVPKDMVSGDSLDQAEGKLPEPNS